MDNYYIEQGEKIIAQLNEGLKLIGEESDNGLKSVIKRIKDELIKTNEETADVHITNCGAIITEIDNFIKKTTDDEIKAVEKNAEKWQGWYKNLKAIEGNKGYDGAKANGFYTNEETITIKEEKKEDKTTFGKSFVYTDSMALTDAILSLNTKKTKTTYYWVAYTDITIDGDGHISFIINNYKKEDGLTTNMRSISATISNDTDYTTYYTNRGSMGGTG